MNITKHLLVVALVLVAGFGSSCGQSVTINGFSLTGNPNQCDQGANLGYITVDLNTKKTTFSSKLKLSSPIETCFIQKTASFYIPSTDQSLYVANVLSNSTFQNTLVAWLVDMKTLEYETTQFNLLKGEMVFSYSMQSNTNFPIYYTSCVYGQCNLNVWSSFYENGTFLTMLPNAFVQSLAFSQTNDVLFSVEYKSANYLLNIFDMNTLSVINTTQIFFQGNTSFTIARLFSVENQEDLLVVFTTGLGEPNCDAGKLFAGYLNTNTGNTTTAYQLDTYKCDASYIFIDPYYDPVSFTLSVYASLYDNFFYQFDVLTNTLTLTASPNVEKFEIFA
eukprot:TRINITY_DN10671_c0_g1_i1.p1 TRINITY_DN10671_c0_g1~~TRINITY_DN10671_c0_g1_i1.p1  ORF type:complete len:334 (+),score=57.82 TRINITY_DN10671_c0_g1_i1:196-1197(+)